MMRMINKQGAFRRADSVEIPEIYNRRFKTGEKDLDALFGGNGFLPGMSFTLAAGPGTGKTTLLIQMLEKLEKTGKKTAYVSSEESVEQLAFTCKRIGVKAVSVANMTCVEDIFETVEKMGFDIVILDSFPALTCREKFRGKQLEEFLSNYICEKAKELELVTGIILHFTKAGTYKGSTLLPHSVDCNIIMSKHKEDPSVREIEVTKNRFGSTGFTSFLIGGCGFDFKAVQMAEGNVIGKKKGKKTENMEKIKTALGDQGMLTMKAAIELTGCSLKAQQILRELCTVGSVTKTGRGQTAVWTNA